MFSEVQILILMITVVERIMTYRYSMLSICIDTYHNGIISYITYILYVRYR